MPVMLFVKGMLVGLAASAPMGPMGVLCVERTLSGGKAHGLASGYGVAFADTLFAALAVFALSRIMDFIELHSTLVRLLGGFVVALLGLRIALHRAKCPRLEAGTAATEVGSLGGGGLLQWGKEMLRALLFTLTNPFCIFIFLALFAFFQVEVDGSVRSQALLLLLGVHIGALLWWGSLACLVGRLRGVLSPRHLRLFRSLSGYLIGVLGVATMVWALWGWLYSGVR